MKAIGDGHGMASHRLTALLLPGLGGIAYVLGNMGYGLWPLALICLIPLWWCLELTRHRSRWLAGGAGLGFGLCLYLSGFPWLLSLQSGFFGGEVWLGYLLWLAMGLWFAAGYSVYALLYQTLRRRGVPQVLAGIAPLILLEWLQPNLFPAHLGTAALSIPVLAQWADLGGPLLLTAVIAAANSIVFALLAPSSSPPSGSRAPSRPVSVIMALLLCVVVFTYGHGRNLSVSRELAAEPTRPLTIGTIQTNQLNRQPDMPDLKALPQHLEQSRELLRHHRVDLLIWPESSLGRSLRRPLPIDAQMIRQDLQVPLLFGASSIVHENGQKKTANSVFLADASGRIEQVYDKSRLIPIAETLPEILSPWQKQLAQWFPKHQQFRRGQHANAIQWQNLSIVTPICFEIIHGDYIRSMIRSSEADLLVTVANDGWFGHSQAPYLHLSLARLRAIEHRIWIVRATNTGISAVINPLGEIVAHTGLMTRETLIANLDATRIGSPYTRWGDWPAGAALIGLLSGLALSFRTREQTRSHRTHDPLFRRDSVPVTPRAEDLSSS